MDINKFKSVAVRKPDYDVLQGLCNQKFRSPASMISKLVNEYVEYQASKKKMSVKKYKEEILDVRTLESGNKSSKNSARVGRKHSKVSKRSK
jgi:hypothetical protein